MEALKSTPVLVNTEFEEITDNSFLKVDELVSESGDVYKTIDIYYQDTEEKHYLGMIHYEDPSHLNMVERYFYNQYFFIVIRQNLATGEIVDYKNAFDIKARRYISDSNRIEQIYKFIILEKEKNMRKNKSTSLFDKIFGKFFTSN